MMRCNLKRHNTIWQDGMFTHNILCSYLDTTLKESVAHEQYANDFTLLDIAKQQDPDGCRVR